MLSLGLLVVSRVGGVGDGSGVEEGACVMELTGMMQVLLKSPTVRSNVYMCTQSQYIVKISVMKYAS